MWRPKFRMYWPEPTMLSTAQDPSKEIVDRNADRAQILVNVPTDSFRDGYVDVNMSGENFARHLGVAHTELANLKSVTFHPPHIAGYTDSSFGFLLGSGTGDAFEPLNVSVGSASVSKNHVDRFHYIATPSSSSFGELNVPIHKSVEEHENDRNSDFVNRKIGRWVIDSTRGGTMGSWKMFTPEHVNNGVVVSRVTDPSGNVREKLVVTRGDDEAPSALFNLLSTNAAMRRPLPAGVKQLDDFQGRGKAFVMPKETHASMAKGLREALKPSNSIAEKGFTLRARVVSVDGTTGGSYDTLPSHLQVPLTLHREPLVASDGHPHLTYGQFHKQFVPDSNGVSASVSSATASHEQLHRNIHGGKLDFSKATFSEFKEDGADDADADAEREAE